MPIFLHKTNKERRKHIEGEIRNSSKALIIKEGKMDAIKIRDADEEWYIIPGGQASEETLNVEGVHSENFHRVDFVFSCEFIDNVSDAILHGDTNQAGVEWLNISVPSLKPLYPSKLRRQIMNFYEGKPYPVYLSKEEVGDPECIE